MALAPFESYTVEAVLKAASLQAPQMREQRAWHLELVNVHNPSNTCTLRVTADVTMLRLRYAGLRWHGRPKAVDDPRSSTGAQPAAAASSTPAPLEPPLPAERGGAGAGGVGAGGATVASAEGDAAGGGGGPDEADKAEAGGAMVAAASSVPSASEKRGRRDAPEQAASAGGGPGAGAGGVAATELDPAMIDAVLEEAKRAQFVRPDGGGVFAAVALPPVVFPVLQSTPVCSATFELHNCSHETLPLLLHVSTEFDGAGEHKSPSEGFRLASSSRPQATSRQPDTYQPPAGVAIETLAELRRGLAFELLARESNTPLTSVTLEPDERLQVRLLVHPSSSMDLFELLPLDTPLLYGMLHIESDTSAGADEEMEHQPPSLGRNPSAEMSSADLNSNDDSFAASSTADMGSSGTGIGGIRDAICLIGSIHRGASFSLNVSQLNFHGMVRVQSPPLPTRRSSSQSSPPAVASPPLSPSLAPAENQVESFWVRNPSLERSLSVKIASLVPPEVGLVRVGPETCRLLPGDEEQIFVKMTPRALSTPPSSTACLRVMDEQMAECSQDVRVVLLERQQMSLPTPQASLPEAMTTATMGGKSMLADPREKLLASAAGSSLGTALAAVGDAPSALGLRGITPVGGSSRRYEIHLGQQSYGSGVVRWELWVENLGDAPLRYRLFPLSTEEGTRL